MTFDGDVSLSNRGLPLGKALFIAGLLLATLFGQYLVGPPNIHSARSLVMLVEVAVVTLWLVNKPQAFLVAQSGAFKVFGVLILLAGAAGIVLSAHNWAAALIGQMEWLTHLLFLVAIVDFIIKGRLSAEQLFGGLVIAGLFAVAFYSARWLLMDEPREFNWFWNAHPFLHMRHFAFLILPAFIAAMYFAVSVERRRQIFGVAAMTVLLAALFWAGGRASIGAAVVGVLAGLTFIARHRSGDFKLLVCKIFLVIFIAAVVSEALHVNHGGMGLSFNHGREGVESIDHLSSGRLSIWLSVINNMEWYQWLVGHGVDNYRYLPERFDETVHPHSWFFQSLSAWGLPVTILFVGGLWFLTSRLLYRQFFKKWETRFDPAVFFGALIVFCYLVLSLVDGNFYHSWAVMLVIPFVGLSIVATCNFRPSPFSEESRLSSGWLYGVAAVVVAVIIQLINVTTVFGGRVPEPGSWRSQMVLAVPYNTIFVESWLQSWQTVDQGQMLRLLRWLQTNSADGYRFMLVESEMLSQAGYSEEANSLYERAVESAPARAKKKLVELGPPSGDS